MNWSSALFLGIVTFGTLILTSVIATEAGRNLIRGSRRKSIERDKISKTSGRQAHYPRRQYQRPKKRMSIIQQVDYDVKKSKWWKRLL